MVGNREERGSLAINEQPYSARSLRDFLRDLLIESVR